MTGSGPAAVLIPCHRYTLHTCVHERGHINYRTINSDRRKFPRCAGPATCPPINALGRSTPHKHKRTHTQTHAHAHTHTSSSGRAAAELIYGPRDPLTRPPRVRRTYLQVYTLTRCSPTPDKKPIITKP